MKIVTIIFIAIALAGTSFSDQEGGNSIYVVGNGGWYAKSIPSEQYGTNGTTRIYLADKDEDKLEYTYNWYSPRELELKQWAWGVSVVRFGPWQRGSQASEKDFAMAFYNGNKLLASYSTLDLAGSPKNVRESMSHYSVIRKVLGYRWVKSNDYVFEIETVDDRILSFDIASGMLVETKKNNPNQRVDLTR